MRIVGSVLALLILTAGAYVFFVRDTSDAQVVEVKWLIAHQPVSLFERAAQTFETTFNAQSTDTTIRVTLIGPSDIAGQGVVHLDAERVHQSLRDGEADIATLPVAALGSDKISAILALPFLFNDYASFASAIDSPAGTELLDRMSTAEARAVAFTLSGGLQTLVTKSTEVESADDIRGLKVATPNGPIAQASLRAFGATPIPAPPGDTSELMRLLEEGDVDAIEIPYTRLSIYPVDDPIRVSETYHSIFLTVALSGSWYESLSLEEQEAFRKAIHAAALVEREDSILLAQETKDSLTAGGSSVIAFPQTEREKLKTLSVSVYTTFGTSFDANLIEALRAGR